MSLLQVRDTKTHPLENNQISNALWIASICLLAGLAVLTLLGRLGLPVNLSYTGVLALFSLTVAILAWRGRTMTGRSFFFADKMGSSATTGFGGGADFAGGAFLLVFASMSVGNQALWVTSLLLGMTFMSVFFSHTLYRETVSTVTGYFAIKYPDQGAGIASIPVVMTVLLFLAMAEFGVAIKVLEQLNSGAISGWIILALAILPALVGGWFSILLVNVVLAIWSIIALLISAFFLGVAPAVLTSDSASLIAGSSLEPISALKDIAIPNDGPWLSLLSIFILAAGFSVVPHSFSRMATVKRPTATMEHIGWASLFVFVAVAISGLSFVLVVSVGDQDQAALLTTNPILHVLPYLALLFIAFNGLSTTILAFSSAAIRSFRRSRREDPGERSMFGTRLLCVLLALSLGFSLNQTDVAVWSFLVSALLLGAGGLFVPLLATTQTTYLPAWCVGLSILVGTSITAYGLIAPHSPSLPIFVASPFISAALAMMASMLIVFLGYLATFLQNRRAKSLEIRI